MFEQSLLNAALFGIGAFLSAFAALTILMRRRQPKPMPDPARGSDLTGDTLVYLLRDGRIVDSNFSGRRYLQRFGANDLDFAILSKALHVSFENADALLRFDVSSQDERQFSRDGRLQAIAERAGPTLRLKITSRAKTQIPAEDVHWLNATENELETLRKTTEFAPYLVWREAKDGTPTWVNRSYLEAAQQIHGRDRTSQWPLPRLFPQLKSGKPARVSLEDKAQKTTSWYEVHSIPIGSDVLFTAHDANAVVQAESQRREFMQTLTKTFSQLTIGLAIFDKSRNLALFNPALTELSRLPPEFLTNRPSLVEFLDKLRERRMMPEPKDYRSWRANIAELEEAAIDGSYSETWVLADNVTYRVTGRPHPDGALAFLFEDISAEMSLTRQFRHELETSQTLLDNMPDATALFSHTGVLLQTNAAYRRLWNVEPDTSLLETTVVDATRTWHDATIPTPIWGDFRDYAVDTHDRTDWSATATLRDGRAIECQFFPLPGGGTQVVFQLKPAASLPQDEQMLEVV